MKPRKFGFFRGVDKRFLMVFLVGSVLQFEEGTDWNRRPGVGYLVEGCSRDGRSINRRGSLGRSQGWRGGLDGLVHLHDGELGPVRRKFVLRLLLVLR